MQDIPAVTRLVAQKAQLGEENEGKPMMMIQQTNRFSNSQEGKQITDSGREREREIIKDWSFSLQRKQLGTREDYQISPLSGKKPKVPGKMRDFR